MLFRIGDFMNKISFLEIKRDKFATDPWLNPFLEYPTNLSLA